MLRRPDHPPDRHARHRARRRDGRAVALVESDGPVLDLWIKTRWLQEGEAGDRSAVGRAIGAMLADAARR